MPLFAALKAAIGPVEVGLVGPNTPARPNGTIVWAHCASSAQLSAVHTLERRLAEDGEIITIIPTLSDTTDPQAHISPNTKRSTRAFLDHWKPQIVLWLGGDVAIAPLSEINRAGIPAIFAEAKSSDLDYTNATRLSRRPRAALSMFADILTVDDASVSRLIKLGANPKTIRSLGMLEDGVTPPPYDEAERADLVEALQARPVWLAAEVPLPELNFVATAYRHAARRAHRTLLVIVPRTTEDSTEMVEILREAGFTVARRSADGPPKEATQIYIADTNDGLGLWCRLAPITYLGGSLTDGQIPDPFAPAAVGSAVLIGNNPSRFKGHCDRLRADSALHLIAKPDDLGGAVETLLATDYAAQLAHAAWDVTSRGADATNELVALIYTYLDRVTP